MIPVGILYFSLQAMVQRERAFLAAITVGAFYVAISREWDRRREKRFWVVVSLLMLAHLVFLTLIKLPHFQGPSLSYGLPMAFADVFAVWGILRWTHAWTKARDTSPRHLIG